MVKPVNYRALSRAEWLRQPLSVVELAMAEEEAALAALQAELDVATAELAAVRQRQKAPTTSLARLELEDAAAAAGARAERLAEQLWDDPERWELCQWLRKRKAQLERAIATARENLARLDHPQQPYASDRERDEAIRWTRLTLDMFDE